MNLLLPITASLVFDLPRPGLAAAGEQSLFEMLQAGGMGMYPLYLCLLAMIFLIVYCVRETSRKRFIPEPALPQISALLQERRMDEAALTLQSHPTVLSRSLGTALGKARPRLPDANREKVEGSLVEMLEAEENGIGQWVNYLNVVATVAPMIGLLGTVGGMIGAFSTIGAQGMGRPEALADDIGKALITTAAGLCVGIPAMIAYFIFNNRLNNQMIQAAQTAGLLLDYLAGEIEEGGGEEEAPD